jgi:hypothetical protein
MADNIPAFMVSSKTGFFDTEAGSIEEPLSGGKLNQE